MVTEQLRESLADLLRAAAGATRREAERCETWSPLAAAAWRVRAKRLRAVADALPDAFTARHRAESCADAATFMAGFGFVVTADYLRATALLLRALAGEEG